MLSVLLSTACLALSVHLFLGLDWLRFALAFALEHLALRAVLSQGLLRPGFRLRVTLAGWDTVTVAITRARFDVAHPRMVMATPAELVMDHFRADRISVSLSLRRFFTRDPLDAMYDLRCEGVAVRFSLNELVSGDYFHRFMALKTAARLKKFTKMSATLDKVLDADGFELSLFRGLLYHCSQIRIVDMDVRLDVSQRELCNDTPFSVGMSIDSYVWGFVDSDAAARASAQQPMRRPVDPPRYLSRADRVRLTEGGQVASKALDITGFSFYLDFWSELRHAADRSPKKAGARGGGPRKPFHNAFLEVHRISLNSIASCDLSELAVAIQIDQIHVSLDQVRLRLLVMLLDAHKTATALRNNYHLRPGAPVSACARAWWRYAILSVALSLAKRRRGISGLVIAHQRHARQRARAQLDEISALPPKEPPTTCPEGLSPQLTVLYKQWPPADPRLADALFGDDIEAVKEFSLRLPMGLTLKIDDFSLAFSDRSPGSPWGSLLLQSQVTGVHCSRTLKVGHSIVNHFEFAEIQMIDFSSQLNEFPVIRRFLCRSCKLREPPKTRPTPRTFRKGPFFQMSQHINLASPYANSTCPSTVSLVVAPFEVFLNHLLAVMVISLTDLFRFGPSAIIQHMPAPQRWPTSAHKMISFQHDLDIFLPCVSLVLPETCKTSFGVLVQNIDLRVQRLRLHEAETLDLPSLPRITNKSISLTVSSANVLFVNAYRQNWGQADRDVDILLSARNLDVGILGSLDPRAMGSASMRVSSLLEGLFVTLRFSTITRLTDVIETTMNSRRQLEKRINSGDAPVDFLSSQTKVIAKSRAILDRPAPNVAGLSPDAAQAAIIKDLKEKADARVALQSVSQQARARAVSGGAPGTPAVGTERTRHGSTGTNTTASTASSADTESGRRKAPVAVPKVIQFVRAMVSFKIVDTYFDISDDQAGRVVPGLVLYVPSFRVSAQGCESKIMGTVLMNDLSLTNCNYRVMAYEPVLERWSCYVKVFSDGTSAKLAVVSERTANINANAALCNFVSRLSTFVSTRRVCPESPPFLFVNLTGRPVTYWAETDSHSVPHAVEARQAHPFAFADNTSVDVDRYVNVHLPGWQALEWIPVDRCGTFLFPLDQALGALGDDDDSDDDAAPDPRHTQHVVCDVSIAESQKRVTMRSWVMLNNQTTLPLEFSAISTSSGSETIGVAQPGKQMPVPVHLTMRCFKLRVRPSEEFRWEFLADLSLIAGGRGLLVFRQPHTKNTFICTCEVVKHYRTESGGAKHSKLREMSQLQRRGRCVRRRNDEDLAHFEIFIRPPLVVHNLLTCPLEYEFNMADNRKVTLDRGTVKQGRREALYFLNLHQDVVLRVQLPFTGWSGEVVLKTYRDNLSRETSRISVMDNNKDTLNLRIASDMHVGGVARTITVSAPYWIENLTGMPLVFRQDMSRRKCAGQSLYEAASSGFSADLRQHTPPPFMFSFGKFDLLKKKMAIKSTNTNWSEPFPIDRVSSNGLVLLKSKRSSEEDRVYAFGVAVRVGADAHRVTKIVTITARYSLVSTMSHPVLVRQVGVSDETQVSPGELVTFHWPHRSKKYRMCISFIEDGWRWSGGFSPDSLGVIQLELSNTRTEAKRVVRVEVKEDGPGIVVLFSENRDESPYRIENDTEEIIEFTQKGLENASWRQADAFCSEPFTWPQPHLKQKLLLRFPVHGITREYTIDVLRAHRPIQLKPAQRINSVQFPPLVVYVMVFADGPTKVLRFSEIDDYHEYGGDLLVDSESGSTDDDTSESGADSFARPLAAQVVPDLECMVLFEGIGLSFTDDVPQEIMYLSVRSVAIYATRSSRAETFHFTAGSIQADNNAIQTIDGSPYLPRYPVLFCAAPPRRAGVGLSSVGSAIGASMPLVAFSASRRIRNSGIQFYDFIELAIQDLELNLEEELILIVMRWVRNLYHDPDADKDPIALGLADAPKLPVVDASAGRSAPLVLLETSDTVDSDQLTRKEIASSKLWYINLLHLHPIRVSMSFASSKVVRDQNDFRNMVGVLGVALKNFKAAPLRLEGLQLRHPLCSVSELSDRISKHYQHSAVMEAYKILGSYEVIGSPIGFLSNLGATVVHYLHPEDKDADGIAEDTGEDIGNDAVPRIHEPAMTETPSTTATADSSKHRMPSSLWDVTRMAREFDADGCLLPKDSPLLNPAQARRDSKTSAMAVLSSVTSRSRSSSMSKSRPPRHFGANNEVLEYDEDEAAALDSLQRLTRGEAAELGKLLFRHELPPKRCLFMTTERLVMSLDGRKISWSYPTEHLQAVETTPVGVQLSILWGTSMSPFSSKSRSKLVNIDCDADDAAAIHEKISRGMHVKVVQDSSGRVYLNTEQTDGVGNMSATRRRRALSLTKRHKKPGLDVKAGVGGAIAMAAGLGGLQKNPALS